VITAAGTAADHASWSSDGQWIVYNVASWRTGNPADDIGLDGQDDALCLMDVDGSNLEILIDEPGVPENHFSWGVSADQ
jgi:Tol biopolymer transport system component